MKKDFFQFIEITGGIKVWLVSSLIGNVLLFMLAAHYLQKSNKQEFTINCCYEDIDDMYNQRFRANKLIDTLVANPNFDYETWCETDEGNEFLEWEGTLDEYYYYGENNK